MNMDLAKLSNDELWKLHVEVENEIMSRLVVAPGSASDNGAMDDAICPHYIEATDGVHHVIVGRCNCNGKRHQ